MDEALKEWAKKVLKEEENKRLGIKPEAKPAPPVLDEELKESVQSTINEPYRLDTEGEYLSAPFLPPDDDWEEVDLTIFVHDDAESGKSHSWERTTPDERMLLLVSQANVDAFADLDGNEKVLDNTLAVYGAVSASQKNCPRYARGKFSQTSSSEASYLIWTSSCYTGKSDKPDELNLIVSGRQRYFTIKLRWLDGAPDKPAATEWRDKFAQVRLCRPAEEPSPECAAAIQRAADKARSYQERADF